jgi:hypothetical protein
MALGDESSGEAMFPGNKKDKGKEKREIQTRLDAPPIQQNKLQTPTVEKIGRLLSLYNQYEGQDKAVCK